MGKHLELRFAYEFIDAKLHLPLSHIYVALLKMLWISCYVEEVMVSLREMGSLEHKADGEGLGTGIRTCHKSTAVAYQKASWEADWKLVVTQTEWLRTSSLLLCLHLWVKDFTVSVWLGYALLVARECTAEPQQTVNVSWTLVMCLVPDQIINYL